MIVFLSSSTRVETVGDSEEMDFGVSKMSFLFLAQILPWDFNSLHLSLAICKMEVSILPFNLPGKSNWQGLLLLLLLHLLFTHNTKRRGKSVSALLSNLGKQQRLFFQWIWVLFPAPTWGQLTPLTTPALQDLTPTSGLQGYCVDMPYSHLSK